MGKLNLLLLVLLILRLILFIENLRPELTATKNHDLFKPVTTATTNFADTSFLAKLCTSCKYAGLNSKKFLLTKTGPNLTLSISLLLTLGGDVELNPGPRQRSIFPCGYCEIAVTWSNAKALCCDECDVWYHGTCIEICSEDFDRFAHSNVVWICGKCHTHNHSNALFHSYELETSNQFAPLSSSPSILNRSISSLNGNFSPTSHSSPVSHGVRQTCRPPSLSSVDTSTDVSCNDSPVGAHAPKNLVSPKGKNWRTLIINCNSAPGKRAEIAHLIDYTQPDALLMTETKVDDTVSSAEFMPLNYKVYRKDRKKGGGGVLLAIKSNYVSEEVPLNSKCEIVCAKVTLRQQKSFHLCSFYRPPGTKTEPVEELNNALNQLKPNSNKAMILGGDFNAGDINWEGHIVHETSGQKAVCQKVIDTLDEHHLEQLQRNPTREGRILDLFCTNRPSLTKYICLIPGISDHDIILADMDLKPQYAKKPSRKIFLHSKADWAKIKAKTKQFAKSFAENHDAKSVEENWCRFENHVKEMISKYIPTKMSRTRYNIPWLTNELRRKCRKKHRFYNRAKSSGKQTHWDAFKAIKHQVARELRRAHWQYVDSVISQGLAENNSRPFWKFVKAQKQDGFGIAPLKENGVIHTESKEKADILNRQFQSVFTQPSGDPTPNLPGRPFPHIPPLTIGVEGVEKLLKGLNASKAAGPDEIPCRVLQELAHEVAPVLTLIFKQSIKLGQIPSIWRKANVAPIFKKGDRHRAENYRPVSLTCISCKLMEHIVAKHITLHFENHNILTRFQHGFRQKRSCETQLLLTLNDFLHQWDNGKQLDVGVLDFSKAFDTVPHDRLLHKLHHYGVRNNINSWVGSFLEARTQCVLVDGTKSDWVAVDSGVPQGTVLGPLLFLTFINDLPSVLSRGTTVRLFADDCIVYREIAHESDQLILQNDLDSLHMWSVKWGMRFNAKKCSTMCITRSKPLTKIYNINKEVLTSVDHTKYLGITIQNNMKWTLHISNITGKANSTLAFLRRNLACCPKSLRETAYVSMVRSILEYCAPIWDPYLQGDINNIEKVQRRSARFVCQDYAYTSSVTRMLGNLGWASLEERRRELRLTLLFKLVFNHVEIDEDDFDTHVLTKADSRTRATHPYKFKQISCKTNVYANSFFPRTIKDWNNLSSKRISCQSVEAFKKSGRPPNRD